MVFSYGFVDPDRPSASWLALDLKDLKGIGAESFDYLTRAKQQLLDSAPTLLILDMGDTVEWSSDFIWYSLASPAPSPIHPLT